MFGKLKSDISSKTARCANEEDQSEHISSFSIDAFGKDASMGSVRKTRHGFILRAMPPCGSRLRENTDQKFEIVITTAASS